MKNFLFLFCTFWVMPLLAQSDTLFVGFSKPKVAYYSTPEMTLLSNNRYGLIHAAPGENGFAEYDARILSSVGTTLGQGMLDIVEDLKIIVCLALIEHGDSLCFIGNGMRNDSVFLITFCSDQSLGELRLVDERFIGKDRIALVNSTKLNATKMVWEGFFDVRKISGGIEPGAGLIYVAIGSNLQIGQFQTVLQGNTISPILDFFWADKSGRYVAQSFNGTCYVFDEGLNFLDKVVLRSDSLNIGDAFLIQNCVEGKAAGYVRCFCKAQSSNAFRFALVDIDFVGDDLTLTQVIPLNHPTDMNIWGSPRMRVDSSFNYVFSGINVLSLGGGPSYTQPNVLTIAKYGSDFNRQWILPYQDHRSFVLRDMEIDAENNIILVGEVKNFFGDHAMGGFLLKIYADGTLSYNEFPLPTAAYSCTLYPNPALQDVFIHCEEGYQPQFIRLFGADGRMCYEGTVADASSGHIRLPDFLPSGMYFYQLSTPSAIKGAGKLLLDRRN